jgi:ribosomal protein L29
MTKKKAVTLNSVTEIENKVKDLKLELAKEKGMLASKTKSTNPTKKAALKKADCKTFNKIKCSKEKTKRSSKKSNFKKRSSKKEIICEV